MVRLVLADPRHELRELVLNIRPNLVVAFRVYPVFGLLLNLMCATAAMSLNSVPSSAARFDYEGLPDDGQHFYMSHFPPTSLPRFYFLGAALPVLAGLYPVLGLGHLGLTIWTVTFWVVLLAAIHAASLGPKVRKVARALGATALVSGVAGFLCYELLEGTHSWVFVVVDAMTLLFLVFATGAVLFGVLRADRISIDHLVGAAAAYCMLGLTFTYALRVLQALAGAPVLLGEGELCGRLEAVADARLADYLYYSFVTLTTLGFGDLTPGTLGARVLTGVEAVTGQLFLTVLIARLIGMHVVHAAQPRTLDGGAP